MNMPALIINLFIWANKCLSSNAWECDGHSIMANIAYQYLSVDAQNAIRKILSRDVNGTTIGDVASWAYEIVHFDAFRWTEALHFIQPLHVLTIINGTVSTEEETTLVFVTLDQ